MGYSKKSVYLELIQKSNNRCYLCGKDISMEVEQLRELLVLNRKPSSSFRLDIDHIVPRARGGNNDVTNLALTHKKCNNKKGHGVGNVTPPIESKAQRLSRIGTEYLKLFCK